MLTHIVIVYRVVLTQYAIIAQRGNVIIGNQRGVVGVGNNGINRRKTQLAAPHLKYAKYGSRRNRKRGGCMPRIWQQQSGSIVASIESAIVWRNGRKSWRAHVALSSAAPNGMKMA